MKALLQQAVSLYQKYPARINGAVASGVCAIALVAGVGLDHDTVLKVVAVLLPLAVGEATHHKVTPA